MAQLNNLLVTGESRFVSPTHGINYNDLDNKPTIPTVNNATLTIQKNGTNVTTFTANASSNATANITVPTKVSELSNDSGFTKNTGTVTSVAVKMNGTTKGTVTSSGTIDLGDVVTSVGNGKLTLQKHGIDVGNFTANQTGDTTLELVQDRGIFYFMNENFTISDTTLLRLTDNGEYVPRQGIRLIGTAGFWTCPMWDDTIASKPVSEVTITLHIRYGADGINSVESTPRTLTKVRKLPDITRTDVFTVATGKYIRFFFDYWSGHPYPHIIFYTENFTTRDVVIIEGITISSNSYLDFYGYSTNMRTCQPDWSQQNPHSLDFIRNKPDIVEGKKTGLSVPANGTTNFTIETTSEKIGDNNPLVLCTAAHDSGAAFASIVGITSATIVSPESGFAATKYTITIRVRNVTNSALSNVNVHYAIIRFS